MSAQRDYQERHRAAGKCTQCRRASQGHSLCYGCRLSKSLKSRERQLRLVRAGGCQSCGRPRGEDGTSIRCRRCAAAANESSRRAKGRRKGQ